MSRAWMWFILSCKRYFRRISFLLILLLLPVALRGIRTAEESGKTEVRIAVYAEKTDETGTEQMPLEQMLVHRLADGGQEESLFRFYICESEQQVRDEVASKRAECGYVIGKDLREKLARKRYKRSIQVFSAPSTVAAGLSSEVVFSVLMELYDGELLVDYVKSSTIFDEAAASQSPGRETLASQAAELYENWLYNGSTFRFTSTTLGMEQQKIYESGENTDTVFPVRGIVAVYIFIIGLYSAAMNLTDEKKGLFFAIPYGYRTICRIAALAAPVFLAALSGVAALWSGGAMTGAVQE